MLCPADAIQIYCEHDNKSAEHNSANISEPIRVYVLIISELAFFILLSLKIWTNPIISNIQMFVTSHFRTLVYISV